LLPLVTAFLVVLPYMVWNYDHFGKPKPVPLAGALGNSLYLATWQPQLPNEDLVALYRGMITPRAEAAGLGDEVRSINNAIGVPNVIAPWNPAGYPTSTMQVESTKRSQEAALRRIAKDPFTYVRHVFGNGWRLWNSGNYPKSIPAAVVIGLRLASWFVFVAGAVGVALSLSRKVSWPIPWPLAALLLYVPAIHVFLHTEARYTAPARPLLLLFAGALCWWLAERLESGKRRMDQIT
jgi:hypothetical protein